MGKPRRRAPLWARIALVVGALLMLFSGGTILGIRVLVSEATSSVTQTRLIDEAGAGSQPGGNDIDGPINMLLVGIDERPGTSAQTAVLSDTIVILHVPASHDQAYLVSIPRDWRVRIPAYGKNGFPGDTNKINSAFSAGYRGGGTELEKRARGVDLLARTLNGITGITFNGAAIIDFAGFEAVLQELGGVTICVDQRATSIHLAEDSKGHLRKIWYSDTDGIQGLRADEHPYVHEPGCRRMPGPLALDYARIRKGLPNGDYDRQRHQQQLIKAILKEATSKGMLTNPIRLSHVIKSAGKAFVLDTQGVPIEDFIFTLRGIRAGDLVTIKTNAGKVHPLRIDGIDYEQLSPESMEMLTAVREGKLAEFLLSHQQFVASSG
ncbi:MAG: LCP family protein [Micromonosporaceae bacterium]|nr:LCP family protein [Micromonosporaceae bacterium]